MENLLFGPSIGADPSNTTVYLILFAPLLRTKKPNPTTKLLAFHGKGIEDALIGRWSSPNQKKRHAGRKSTNMQTHPLDVITLRIKYEDFACAQHDDS